MNWAAECRFWSGVSLHCLLGPCSRCLLNRLTIWWCGYRKFERYSSHVNSVNYRLKHMLKTKEAPRSRSHIAHAFNCNSTTATTSFSLYAKVTYGVKLRQQSSFDSFDCCYAVIYSSVTETRIVELFTVLSELAKWTSEHETRCFTQIYDRRFPTVVTVYVIVHRI